MIYPLSCLHGTYTGMLLKYFKAQAAIFPTASFIGKIIAEKKNLISMKKPFTVLSGIALSILLFNSCSKSTSSNGGNTGGGITVNCALITNKSFAADVNPIIQSVCNMSGCHAAGSTNGPGPLTTYTEVFNARTRVRSAIASGIMPQGTTLTTAQKSSIICWIDGGAPND